MNGTVFIVDDDAAVRRALAAILEGEGFSVRPFESAEAFLETCEAQAAGCILLDLRLEGMDGLQAQDAIAARGITLPVIFLTGHGDIPKSVRARKAGAIDFLQKPVAADTLLARVYSALRIDEARRSERRKREQACALLARLTVREEQVLKRILAGRSAKQIGKELGISPRTIEVYRKNVLLKTQCANLLALSDLYRVAREEPALSRAT
jgi:two-component system response regulator FixJ